MEVEITAQEGFGKLKKAAALGFKTGDSFVTPSLVHVPFMRQARSREAEEESHGDLGSETGIIPALPIINLSGLPLPRDRTSGFSLYLADEGHVASDGCTWDGYVLYRSREILLPPLGKFSSEETRFSVYRPVSVDGRDNPSASVVSPNHLSGIIDNPKLLLETVRKMREKHTGENLFYAPGVASPYNLAYLVSLGFDLFDTVLAARDAAASLYWGGSRRMPLGELTGEYLDSCGCVDCKILREMLFGDGSDPDETLEQMGYSEFEKVVGRTFAHNVRRLWRAVLEARKMVEHGTTYVGAHGYATGNGSAAAILRLLYREFARELIAVSPRAHERTLLVTQKEMLDHPDIIGYTKRLQKSYLPPQRPILLLVPCSYRKPYSRSKTHRNISRILKGHPLLRRIHRVVITSPLGAVPMELDKVYPAANYDLPVTGDWDERETERAGSMLEGILSKGAYETVITLLGDETFLVRDIVTKHFDHCHIIGKGARSDEGLKELKTVLNRIAADMPHRGMEGGRRNSRGTKENIPVESYDEWGILTFQFDEVIARRLMEGARIGGRRGSAIIRDLESGEQIARQVPARGFFALGTGAAERLVGIERNRVFIDDFQPKGTVFSVGIRDADEGIRPGDEVLILYDDEPRGIGRAMVSGCDMKDRKRGIGVKVRHSIKGER